MILSLHCQDNTSLAVKYSTYWESVKGNRVSPWDGSPFDSVCKHRLNEKLEMRNAKCEMVVRRIKTGKRRGGLKLAVFSYRKPNP